jgi:hypothetical protein
MHCDARCVTQVLAIFCGLVLLATTFISHTVGAMVILPIVQAVGAQMEVSSSCTWHAPFVEFPCWRGHPAHHAGHWRKDEGVLCLSFVAYS